MAASRLTPIEKAIQGERPDRRAVYAEKMAARGFKRVSLWVPGDQVALLKELKEFLIHSDRLDELRQFFRCDYEQWLLDPEISQEDQAFARQRLADLACGDGPSVASDGAEAIAPGHSQGQ